MAATEPGITQPPEAESLKERYVNAYRVSRFVVTLGDVVKYVGGVIAVFLGLLGAVKSPEYGANSGGGFVFAAILVAGVIWGISFIAGVLICAKGELLKATLDGAINTSPFVSNQDRKEIMSL